MQKFKFNDFTLKPQGKIAKRMIYQDDKIIAFVLNIAPGASLPGHTHENSTLLLNVLNGQAQVIADETAVSLTEGELIQVNGPENMRVDNTGQDTLSLYVTISPLPGEHYAQNADI